MMKIKSSIFLLTLLLTASLIAQDSFVRSAVIDPPSTYPSGFGATVAGVDLDGDGKLEIYSVDGMTDFNTGDEIPQIIKYEQNGTAWDSVWAASFPNERQNTWAALTTGDLDGDGKQEIIWGYVNSFSTNTTPDRIVVFEANGDDVLGVSDGAGNYTPNTAWNMDIPESVNMRPLKWEAYDIDNDGKQEVIFAERRDQFNFGIVSVSDVPDAADGSETWTMEFNKDTQLTDQFLRSNVIEGPDGGFGNMVTDIDLDGNGLMDLYAINNDWSDGANGELIPTLFKYELVAGSFVERWSTVIPGVNYQNTWPVLTSGDLDGDGLGEIIWCPVNNFGAGNEDYPRIVVYETPADSATKESGILGIDNGDGTLSPNSMWNMGVPASTNMRVFRGQISDIDNDGKEEFVFAERRNYYGWGVASVDNIPNDGDGSETWTLEAAGANMLNMYNLDLTFEDDSDVANWGNHDEGTVYTTVAHNPNAGVDSTGALELGDAGYAMLSKRPVSAKAGVNFSVSVDIKTENWNTPDTYKLYLIVEGFADADSVLINSDSGFTHFTLSGVTTGDAGYVKIAGGNTLLANKIWVDNLVYSLDDGTTAPSSDYRDLAVIDQTMYVFDSDGGIVEVDGANSYAKKDRYQAYPGWSWLSANTVDIDGDGTEEIVTGDYSTSGSHGVWVLTQDADTLVGYQIADFSANAANKITSVRAGYITADSLIDFTVGFRGTDEIWLVSYNGGDITSDASYTVKMLDKGVLGADGVGQMDAMFVANIDGEGFDEVLYSGVPRGIDANTQPLTIGSYADTLTADAGRRWDMVVANGAAHFFNGSGSLQSVYYDGNGYKLTKTQTGLVNGSFLSASATDVDGDGTEEIITGNWYDAKVNMLVWKNGAWEAHAIADFADLGGVRLNGGSVGDIDGDGNIDFVTGSRTSVPNGQIYRVEYTGGDMLDASNWNATVIDEGMNDLFTQYEVVHIANLDDDADMEVLYTSDYARGPNSGADAPFPIVILDLQKTPTETIAAVRIDDNGDGIADRAGEDVAVKGVVTSIKSFSGTSVLIAIQDESAGIWVFQSGNDSTDFALGTLLLVKGELAQYRGLTEIYATDLLSLGTATVPEPIELTIDEYQADPELYEGSLVKINAITKTESSVWPDSGSHGGSFYFTDGYKEVKSYLDGDVYGFENPEPTWPANVTTIASQYSSSSSEYLDGYQLSTRGYSDFEQDVKAAPTPYFFFTDETRAYDGGVMNIDDSSGTYQVSWHPSVDLNGDALLYQFVLISADDGSVLVEEMSDNNGVDTTTSPTGTDIIELIQSTGTDSLVAYLTVRTTDLTTGVIPSVDTLMVTFKDLATGINGDGFIPKEFFVDQNYPNPFNPSTTIQFGLPAQAQVNLVIYDILGREVTRLVNNKVMNAGVYKFNFNASQLASGTYIYRLQADKKVEVKKMLLLK